MTFFGWSNWAIAQAIKGGKEPLLINMDETPIPYSFSYGRGTVLKRRKGSDYDPRCTEKLERKDLRGNITHVAFICNDVAIQPKLPQILIGNQHRFTVKLLRQMEFKTPGNVYLVRAKSSWMCHGLMLRTLRLLHFCMKDYMDTRQLILIVDVAPCHIHRSIFLLAERLDIYLVFVPAKLTWLLQPCDTHAFLKFKRRLRAEYEEGRLESEDGILTPERWLEAIFEAIRAVLCEGKWAAAFAHNGIAGSQAFISKFVLNNLEWKSIPIAGSSSPAEPALKSLFPLRTKAPAHLLVKNRFLPRPKLPVMFPAPLGVPLTRLKKHMRAAQPAPPAAAGSSSSSSSWARAEAVALLAQTSDPPLPPPEDPPPLRWNLRSSSRQSLEK